VYVCELCVIIQAVSLWCGIEMSFVSPFQAVLLVGWRMVSGYTTVIPSRRKRDKVHVAVGICGKTCGFTE